MTRFPVFIEKGCLYCRRQWDVVTRSPLPALCADCHDGLDAEDRVKFTQPETLPFYKIVHDGGPYFTQYWLEDPVDPPKRESEAA
jgi:hypothetical protein